MPTASEVTYSMNARSGRFGSTNLSIRKSPVIEPIAPNPATTARWSWPVAWLTSSVDGGAGGSRPSAGRDARTHVGDRAGAALAAGRAPHRAPARASQRQVAPNAGSPARRRLLRGLRSHRPSSLREVAAHPRQGRRAELAGGLQLGRIASQRGLPAAARTRLRPEPEVARRRGSGGGSATRRRLRALASAGRGRGDPVPRPPPASGGVPVQALGEDAGAVSPREAR